MPVRIPKSEHSARIFLVILGPCLWGVGLAAHGALRAIKAAPLDVLADPAFFLAVVGLTAVNWHARLFREFAEDWAGWGRVIEAVPAAVSAMPVLCTAVICLTYPFAFLPPMAEAAVGILAALLSVASARRSRLLSLTAPFGRLAPARP